METRRRKRVRAGAEKIKGEETKGEEKKNKINLKVSINFQINSSVNNCEKYIQSNMRTNTD
jgi:hypothetical protein